MSTTWMDRILRMDRDELTHELTRVEFDPERHALIERLLNGEHRS